MNRNMHTETRKTELSQLAKPEVVVLCLLPPKFKKPFDGEEGIF
jgi:hypothetical protein